MPYIMYINESNSASEPVALVKAIAEHYRRPNESTYALVTYYDGIFSENLEKICKRCIQDDIKVLARA